jgi:hypothetical protein
MRTRLVEIYACYFVELGGKGAYAAQALSIPGMVKCLQRNAE